MIDQTGSSMLILQVTMLLTLIAFDGQMFVHVSNVLMAYGWKSHHSPTLRRKGEFAKWCIKTLQGINHLPLDKMATNF